MKLAPALLAATTALFAFGAHAEDLSKWSVRAGPTHIKFNTKAPVAINGVVVPDSNATFDNAATVGVELAYGLNESVSLRFLLGWPPISKAGARLAGLSLDAGKVTFGPIVGSVTWSPGSWGRLKPYVGAGVAYAAVLKEEDSDSISNLNVDSAWGSVIQIGADYALDKRWGLFADARYVFLKTRASGTAPAFGGASVTAEGELNPLAVHLGVSYRF